MNTYYYTHDGYKQALLDGKTIDNDEKMLRTVMNADLFMSFMKEKIAESKTYLYLVTFTVNNKKYRKSWDKKIEEYLASQKHRKSALGLIRFEYSKEYTKKGYPHWHVLVHTKKFLKKNRFTPYIKNWGTIDISKSKSNKASYIEEYISKHVNSIKVI